MNSKSVLFSILLLFWMGGSTYWYVCKIKKHCEKKQQVVREQIQPPKSSVDTVKVNITVEKEAENAALKERLEQGVVISGFPYNSTENTFNNDFDKYLSYLKAYLEKDKTAKVVLTGYTDSEGTEEYNYKLSEERALNVKNYLINAGINENRITVKAEGENNPVADNNTEYGRAQNRRVEVKLIEN